MLEIRFLGKFDIRIDGVSIELPARKAQSLFAYLVLNIGVQHRREKVAGILWPDSDEASARSKLRYALWQLRKAIGDQYFLSDKLSLAINHQADYWVDCAELENKPTEHLTTEELGQVVALYKGEFLPGFYEDWILLTRDQLHATFEQRMALLLQRLSNGSRWREVLDWAERWISLGQTPEPAFQALMVAHSHLGDRANAANAYQRCEQTLGEQLAVEPSELTKKIYDLISNGEVPDVSLLYPAFYAPKSQIISQPYRGVVEVLPEPERKVFVAREMELAWLDGKLELALAGHGQVVFVIGDAGQGKTALLHKFSQRAHQLHGDLVAAYGTCEAYSGIGDPHLPFRDIMALLTGDVETKQSIGVINQENARRLWELIPQSSEALVEYGPDLIDSFVPGEALSRRASSYTADRPFWLERLEREVEQRRGRAAPVNIDHGDSKKDLFDQYTRVLQSLVRKQPLLLILDDLQWADLGTIGLLFHIARRIEGHRILILGAYRPDDVAQFREGELHPLVQMLTELKRIFGDMEVNLDQTGEGEGRQFIDDFLDTEPNRLDEGFRQALYLHTAGHPLFTIELLRQMQEQGDLLQDDQGRWIESQVLGWETMPARVEAVIERRVGRLPITLREVLDVASVEGEEFTAEVIAGVKGLDEAEIIRQLSQDLDKRHMLVEASGIKRIGQQRLSIYRFRHNLFQKYVYENLDIVERVYLHEKVGDGLEHLYGEHTEQIAVHLARHYEAAGVIEKTIDYLIKAGNRAKRVSANEQAVAYLCKGIDLLKELPEGNKRDETELALQISLGAPLVATQGYASPEVERTFERARELCERTGDIQQLAPALWGLCAFYQVRGKHSTAYEIANQILALAESGENSNLMLLAHWMLGLTLTHLGDFSLAREHLEFALNQYDFNQDDSLTYLYGQNPRVTCLNYLALNLWILGYPDQALERCNEAVSMAQEISHPFSLSFAHGMAALFHSMRRDSEAALEHSEQTIKLAKKSSFPFLLTLGMIIRGWARVHSGKTGMAIKLMQNGIEAMQMIGAEIGRPFFLSLLAEGYRGGGDIEEGLKVLETALEKAKVNGEHWYDSGLYWLMGKLSETQGTAEAETTARYWQAIEIAGLQEANSFELQAAIALVKHGEGKGQAERGKELLRVNYQWFEEGLDSDLLVEASALIDQEILK
jgi:predicted ATPase/DNA-binding SARP family transcriptional activator